MLSGMDKVKYESVESFLARGGRIKKMRDCSPKEAMFRSNRIYKDQNNPNRILRKPLPRPTRLPTTYSGYNSGKK